MNVSGHSWLALLCIVAELTGDPELAALLRQLEVENAEAQVEHRGAGGDRKSEEYHEIKHAVGTNGLGSQGSNSKSKPLRRLVRKARGTDKIQPDPAAAGILARYEAGEFPGVRAAAREARLVKEPTPPK